MTTLALNNLWTYIQGLSLAKKDREWLASKLIEPTEKQAVTKSTTKAYKVKPVSSHIKKWSGCASFTESEIENDPRLKALLNR
jgi:hypothetical protein